MSTVVRPYPANLDGKTFKNNLKSSERETLMQLQTSNLCVGKPDKFTALVVNDWSTYAKDMSTPQFATIL